MLRKISQGIRAGARQVVSQYLFHSNKSLPIRNGAIVLMYHNVGYEPKDRGTIAPDELATQWRTLLALGYVNVSLDFIQQRLAARQPFSGSNFAITFDDARDGVYEHALPLLRSMSVTATTYVVTGFVGSTRWLSYYKQPPTWVTKEEAGCTRAFTAKYMSEDQLRRWLDAGHSVGSHTQSHQHLPCLSDRDLETEIRGSALIIEDRFSLARGSTHFAYPYGEYNRRVMDAVTAHHRTAVTIEQGAVTHDSPGFAISRFSPGWSAVEMLRRLSGLRSSVK